MVTDNLLETLLKLSSEMSSHNDHIHAQKVDELNSKLTAGRLTIALCGHFSAGKSTLLNTLCGAKLLPSSPIPTSANVVTIAYGEQSKAKVKVSANGEVRYDEVEIDQLAAYCKDGETYVSVHIEYPSDLLKKGIVVLDTPGIDSTDAAHKLATESALHMADVVFYVMDYNHVQSEINFTFAKELREWGKPLYFIVNQIDKHREEELSFESYQQSVAESFQAWHLEPAGILYLSLRSPQHPYHQWDSLLRLMDELQAKQEQLTSYSVYSSLSYVTGEYISDREQATEPAKQGLLAQIGGEEALEGLEKADREAKQGLKKLQEDMEQFSVHLRKEIESLLDNANITPAALRDVAHEFLASRKPGFRAGLLASKQKTAAVQAERLQTFYSELVKLTEANILWHMQTLLRQAAEGIAYDRQQLEDDLRGLDQAAPTEQLLLDAIHAGAVFDNAYTVTYCKDLAASIKANYRRAGLSVVDRLSIHYRGQMEGKLEQLQAEKLNNADKLQLAEQYWSMLEQERQYREQLEKQLLPKQTMPQLPQVVHVESEPDNHISFVEQQEVINLSAVASQSQAEQKPSSAQGSIAGADAAEAEAEALSATLKQSASLLAELEGMEQLTEELLMKASRLANRTYTISLFGAFSAGKSSLANALIGERVLPVSPNPTTAAINSLLPPDEQHRHDTATIYMKSHELMLDDIAYSLKLLGYELSHEQKQSESYLFKLIDSLAPESIHNGGRAHYSFVKAAREGWEEQAAWLGKQREVDRNLYQAYVAEEQRSCFVAEIKFYYDCPLTKAGIILVDTPGADSVNARHTGVAFNYIKSTDAILFVTYYNHAFSHADSQFLDQLGRVKDQFELDKMFFIVNAADLASSGEELQAVMNHVEQNLNRHGIMSPRMFPVSSLHALEGKLAGDPDVMEASGITRFEQAFHSFIHHELGAMAINAAQLEQKRAVSVVGNLLSSARTAKLHAQQQIESIHNSLTELADWKEAEAKQKLPMNIKQEIEELMYYIVQRLSFRFGDFYNYAFNPAVLKDDGRSISQAVWTAWLELQRSLSLELQQELLATTMRVERAVDLAVHKQLDSYAEQAAKRLAGYEKPGKLSASCEQPVQPEDWHEGTVSLKWLSSRIKSPKQFFEGDGKAKLRKELEAIIFPSMEQWMKQVQAQWQEHYEQQWLQVLSQQLDRAEQGMRQYGKQQLRLLEDESYVSKLEVVCSKMEQLENYVNL